jgi:hypothetical protein
MRHYKMIMNGEGILINLPSLGNLRSSIYAFNHIVNSPLTNFRPLFNLDKNICKTLSRKHLFLLIHYLKIMKSFCRNIVLLKLNNTIFIFMAHLKQVQVVFINFIILISV